MAFEEELNKRRVQREKLRQQRLAQQKKTVWGLIAAALVLIGCTVLIFVAAGNKNPSVEPPPQDTHVEDTQPQTTQPQTVTKKETVIRLSAAGDLNVTDKTVASGDMGGNYDFTKAFMDVTPLLTESDLTVLNFEGSLCGAPYGDGNLGSAPIELMQALRNSGVDLVQVANSCSINHGLLYLRSLREPRTGRAQERLYHGYRRRRYRNLSSREGLPRYRSCRHHRVQVLGSWR